MSTLEVDKIIPQSGTNLQVGEASDTIKVPSGATLDIESGATLDATGATITGFDAASDEKVKVTANDTTPGFLTTKVLAGTNISLTVGNASNNETLTAAFTGNLNASITNAGTFADARIPNLNASKITAGTLDAGRIPNLNASKINAGTIATARLGSGTANATTFLRGDQTYAEAGGGITMADQWRLTTATTFSSGASNNISSNWERTDTTGYGTIGSAMSQSSGTFTFPATGIYLIMYKLNGKSASSGNNRYVNGNLYTSTDGSGYAIAARGAAGPAGENWDFDATAIFIFDVANTSTHKVQMGYEFEQSTRVYGGTNDSQTCVTFIRLGDT